LEIILSVVASNALAGVNVLVTRPQHQCAALANGIRAEGGNPVLFPVLIITDVDNPDKLMSLIQRLYEFDWAVFVSPNAVHKAMQFIKLYVRAFWMECVEPLFSKFLGK